MSRLALIAMLVACFAGSALASPCKSNLLIVLDRSCSMKKPPNDKDPEIKWDLAVAAIGKLTTDFKGKIRFGLSLFPDTGGEDCAQGKIPIPVGDDNEQAIVDLLKKTDYAGPCVTNIDTAMSQTDKDPALDDEGRRSFVLLLTDGAQSGSCGGTGRDPDTVKIIEKLFSKRWVPTYVVGFGGAVRKASLEAFATAGGLPLSGTPNYFQADDAKGLDEALAAIGDVVGSIEFGCKGMPCPDGRCRDAALTCANGFCVSPTPDGGTTMLDAGTADGGISADASTTGPGAGVSSGSGGCSCKVAAAPAMGWLLALGLLVRIGVRRGRAR